MLKKTLFGLLALLPLALPAEETVRVRLDTTAGPILLELYPERAPVTVANFLAYVDDGHYNEATFYRTVSFENDNGRPFIDVIQGGMGEREGLRPPIAHETTEQTGLRHENGTISMARGAVGTTASEFFICIGDQPALDFGGTRNADGQGFAAFGKVIGGMATVHRIHGMEASGEASNDYTRGQVLTEPVRITSATRVED